MSFVQSRVIACIALSLDDKINGQYKTVSTLEMQAATVLEIYLEAVDFPLTLVKL